MLGETTFVLVAVSALGSFSATDVVRVAALRLSAVDRPGGRRVHRRPTPRLGGLGVFWGFSLALLVWSLGLGPWTSDAPDPRRMLGLLAGSALMVIVGMADDLRGLSWGTKLGYQAVAGLALHVSGWRLESLGVPGLGTIALGDWSPLVVIAWVLIVTNSLNLIDGLDGLACGLALVASLTALVMPEMLPASRIAAGALAGALLGFLWFNFSPALIFLGDSGSLFVGFVLSAVSLGVGSGAGQPGSLWPLAAVLLLAVPLADTLYAVLRRLLGRPAGAGGLANGWRRIVAPDRGHVHHVLLSSGLSPRGAVAVLWAAAAGFAATAWIAARHPMLGLPLALAASGSWLGWFKLRSRRRRVLADALSSRSTPSDSTAEAGALERVA